VCNIAVIELWVTAMKLFEYIEAIEDPRKPKGVRHPVHAILKAVIIGLLAGHTKVEQIAWYIKTVWEEVAEPLGFTHWHAPDDDTYRNVLKIIPAESLSTAFSKWTSDLLRGQILDAAVDGKACRGFQQGDDPRNVFMMLNVFAHDIQLVLGQWKINEKEGEPTVFAEHLQELLQRYPGIRLFTGDAYFSGRNLCQAITELNRHYLVRIKGNQPAVEEALESWFAEVIKKNSRRP
jgi:hypothetical protein